MRAFMMAGVVLWASVAQAQEGGIRGTIEGQIDALKADDFAQAFTFASPAIKGIFGTPERFGQMVQHGYPMVHRPAEVQFLGLEDKAGRKVQRVMIRDAAGRLHFLDYEMIEADGAWQINGVRLLPPQGAGA
jgi:hypothetical protein